MFRFTGFMYFQIKFIQNVWTLPQSIWGGCAAFSGSELKLHLELFSAVKLANKNQQPTVSEWNFFPLCAARIVATTYTRACILSSEKIEPFYDDI